MLNQGTEAARHITPPGFVGGLGSNQARAHLLARSLGGLGNIAENLVTFAQNPSKSPIMRDIEASIYKAVDSGQRVLFSATPIYAGNQLVPKGITIAAKGPGGFSVFVTILNALVKP
jgi:hypothetical protein